MWTEEIARISAMIFACMAACEDLNQGLNRAWAVPAKKVTMLIAKP